MKLLRIPAACVLIALGVPMLLFGLVYTFGNGADSTVEHSKALQSSFKFAAKYVFTFKEQNSRMPTEQEFEVWSKGFPSTPHSSPNGMWLKVSQFPDEAVKKFGTPTPDSFLLVYWRGEWLEYYSSWADRTSMQFDASKYYLFGSKYVDGALILILAVLALIGARKMWPNPSINRTCPGKPGHAGYLKR